VTRCEFFSLGSGTDVYFFSRSHSIRRRFQRGEKATKEQWESFYYSYGPSTRHLARYSVSAEATAQFCIELDEKIKSLSLEKLRSVLFRTEVLGKNAEEATSWQWVAGLNPGIKRSTLAVFTYGHDILRLVEKRFTDAEWEQLVREAFFMVRQQ
jgi:hypothetical protein